MASNRDTGTHHRYGSPPQQYFTSGYSGNMRNESPQYGGYSPRQPRYPQPNQYNSPRGFNPTYTPSPRMRNNYTPRSGYRHAGPRYSTPHRGRGRGGHWVKNHFPWFRECVALSRSMFVHVEFSYISATSGRCSYRDVC